MIVAHAANMGLALCPGGRGVFPDQTVRDNLVLGGYRHRREPAVLGRGIGQAFDMFPVLRNRQDQLAGTLPKVRSTVIRPSG